MFAQGQADRWDFMPGDINHPGINTQFIRFLGSLDPSLVSEANRTAALSMVGSRFGCQEMNLNPFYTQFPRC